MAHNLAILLFVAKKGGVWARRGELSVFGVPHGRRMIKGGRANITSSQHRTLLGKE